MAEQFRIEKDSLGELKIPANAYWGTTTQRAIESYPISGMRAHPRFITAFVMLKVAAAQANKKNKSIPGNLADAIVQAGEEILAGGLADQFPVDVYQMGAGTSFHMNINEVLANRASEILGGKLGGYEPVNANDHVNFGQSTNDAFPTAIRLAALLGLRDGLLKDLEDFEKALRKKGKEFDSILKSARTHLQDAVPIRLGQEFTAYAEAIAKCRKSILFARESVTELGIGGSAAGTGLNTGPGYREAIVANLRKITKIADLQPSPDMCEAMQSQRCIGELSAALRSLAIEVSRISNDLRLLSSGPTTGLDEIRLPAIAPGSSIMPGKINPSMPEMANQVCFQVIGNDTAIAWAVGAGQLELNVMMPLMAHNINWSIHIMGTMLRQMTDLCVLGIKANKERCDWYNDHSVGLATALNTHIGYKNAAMVAKEAAATGKRVTDVLREKGILTDAQIREIMDPVGMTSPGIPGKKDGKAKPAAKEPKAAKEKSKKS
ncbi:MAG: aspartate ammonia-lyase [Candidatus Sumerlaeia bacterium]|nr:aspartate ammonia-lyase [Candidatus Sumerlaeia bacterium]